jgi:hypothetical protein
MLTGEIAAHRAGQDPRPGRGQTKGRAMKRLGIGAAGTAAVLLVAAPATAITSTYRRAIGTMRLSGSDVPVDEGEPADCHSGEVPWRARRR